MVDKSKKTNKKLKKKKKKFIKLHSAYVAGVPSVQRLHCALYSDLKALPRYGTNTSRLKD